MSKLFVTAVASLLVIGMATPVFAHDGSDHSEPLSEKLNDTKSRVAETIKDTNESAKSVRDELKVKRNEAQEFKKTQKEKITEQRTALKQEIDTTRTERKTELKDKRLALCQEREDKINELVATSAKAGRERLAHIQKVEKNVKEFYSRQKLESSEYDAASVLVDEKESIAEAAVQVTETQEFSCSKVDGDNPSGELKTLHDAKREALNNYRDSVKQLVQIVKSARSDAPAKGSAS